MSQDPCSQANHLDVVSVHIDFEWTVDFARKIVSGSAAHTLSVRTDGVEEVV